MTDYTTQNSSEPLTPMNQEVNQPYNFNVANLPNSVNYRTPCSCCECFFYFLFFIVLIFLTCFIFIRGIQRKMPIYISLMTFFSSIIFYILLITMTISTKIHIDNSVGIIIKTRIKSLFCFNESKKIQINDVDKVIKKKLEHTDEDNGHSITYRIDIRLLNGKIIEGCKMSNIDECNRAFNILRNGLPENIIFSDNFAH